MRFVEEFQRITVTAKQIQSRPLNLKVKIERGCLSATATAIIGTATTTAIATTAAATATTTAAIATTTASTATKYTTAATATSRAATVTSTSSVSFYLCNLCLWEFLYRIC